MLPVDAKESSRKGAQGHAIAPAVRQLSIMSDPSSVAAALNEAMTVDADSQNGDEAASEPQVEDRDAQGVPGGWGTPAMVNNNMPWGSWQCKGKYYDCSGNKWRVLVRKAKQANTTCIKYPPLLGGVLPPLPPNVEEKA